MNLNRRQLIKSIAATTLLPCVTPSIRAQSGKLKQTEMSLGLVTYLWGQHWDLPTLISSCEKAGVLGVELRTQHAHKVEPSLSPKERNEVRRQFADSQVTVLGPGTNWAFHDPDPAKLRQNIEGAKGHIKLSHDIGGTGVKVKPNALPKGVPIEKTIEQIGTSLNALGKFAEGYGQQIRVEVHGRETQELPVMKQIMDVADNRSVTVCWNSNDADLSGKGLVHNFDLVQDRFGATCHVRELNVGKYPYAQLMELLVGIDYNGWVLLECRTNPKDKVAALKEQQRVFHELVSRAVAAQKS